MAESKELFQLSIQQTAAETGFTAALIEKDYYCSLILKEIFLDRSHDLIFKGGTLLNKVHVGFYRLSEDLDFSISISPEMSRKDRSSSMKPIRKILDKLESKIKGLTFKDPFRGYNSSAQYNACLEYESFSLNTKDTILFEIGLREEVLIPPITINAKTLVKDAISGDFLINPYPVQCLTKIEAYAEKLRAALTRAKPAIRDIFDLDYALRYKILDVYNKEFQELTKIKLVRPEPLAIDLFDSKKQILESQLETQLRPVLREEDYRQFDFEKAWSDLNQIASHLDE